MVEHMPVDPDAEGRLMRLDDGDAYVVQNGEPGAPALLLLTNAVAPVALWDPVVPALAGACHVIRVGLLGEEGLASPGPARYARRYDVPAQAHQVGAVLDRLGVKRATVAGHSSGGMVATALAEQRPGTVAAMALINSGPSPDAKLPDPRAARLLQAPLAGPLLWRLKTPATIRRAASTGFTRPVDLPDNLVEHMQRITYQAFTATMRGYWEYISQRSLPGRLAPMGLPVLVIFGAEDRRWRSESAEDYLVVPGARVEMLPGVGHSPMVEEPETTARLLLDFAAAVRRP